jgi:hypothetical protein
MGADLLPLPRDRRQPYYCQKGPEIQKKTYVINVGTVQVLTVGDVRREQLTDFSPLSPFKKGAHYTHDAQGVSKMERDKP